MLHEEDEAGMGKRTKTSFGSEGDELSAQVDKAEPAPQLLREHCDVCGWDRRHENLADCYGALMLYINKDVLGRPATKRVLEAGYHAIVAQLKIENGDKSLPRVPGWVFKGLKSEEEEEFRQWARDNFKKGEPASYLWHPVVRDEWERLEELE